MERMKIQFTPSSSQDVPQWGKSFRYKIFFKNIEDSYFLQASYKLYYEPYHQDDIRWNFEKFLLNHKGEPVRRYDESLDPKEIIPDIDNLLEQMKTDTGSLD